jgi:hypothetical protein
MRCSQISIYSTPYIVSCCHQLQLILSLLTLVFAADGDQKPWSSAQVVYTVYASCPQRFKRRDIALELMRWRHYMLAYIWQIPLQYIISLILFSFEANIATFWLYTTQPAEPSSFYIPNHLRSFSFICAFSFLFHLPWATKHGLSWQTCLNHY